MAFAQLVFYLRHLDADGGTLPSEAAVAVAQGGVLCVELLAEDFEKGLGIIQLLLVGGTHTEQVGHTVALAPCLHNLFLSGGYLLQDIRPLAFHGLDTGLQLEFLQIELDGIYNAYLLPSFSVVPSRCRNSAVFQTLAETMTSVASNVPVASYFGVPPVQAARRNKKGNNFNDFILFQVINYGL